MQRTAFRNTAAFIYWIACLTLQSLPMAVAPAQAQSAGSDVELGRLEISAIDPPVLLRAELEAKALFKPEMSDLYNLSLAEILDELKANPETLEYIQSPIQNLALFRDLLADGEMKLKNVSDQDHNKLFAVFLGVASDKDLPITEATVQVVVANLSRGLDDPLPVDAVWLAPNADAIRSAIQSRSD